MLATHFFSKSINRTKITLPYQWLNITFLAIRSNSSASGSSSSDSDSDSESQSKNTNRKPKKLDYLQNVPELQKKRQIEKQIFQAAQLLNETSGREREKIVSCLLDTIAEIQEKDVHELRKSKMDQNKMKRKEKITDNERKKQSMTKSAISQEEQLIRNKRRPWHDTSGELSIIRMLKEHKTEGQRTLRRNEIEKLQQKIDEPSVIKILKDQQRKGENLIEKIETKEEQPSVIRMLKDQQRKGENLIEKKEEQPSVIRMLKDQQRKGENRIEKIETKEEQPSVIRMLKDQQRKGENLIEKIETKQGQPSIINMLMRQKNDRLEQTIDRSKTREERRRTAEKMSSEELFMKRRAREDFDYQSQQSDETFEDRFASGKKFREPSIINMLKSQGRVSMGGPRQRYKISKDDGFDEQGSCISLIDLLTSSNKRAENTELNEIFTSKFTENLDTPVLKLWDMCENRELKASVKHYPQNAFQEMIDWTNEGKIWRFPIDNEQGMEEEQSVHFSKHVFLENHLSPWCPTKGPIRHFMELVCCGLSKNPYMTIQEKYDHIMWYKDYFKDKQDLLHKLGLVE